MGFAGIFGQPMSRGSAASAGTTRPMAAVAMAALASGRIVVLQFSHAPDRRDRECKGDDWGRIVAFLQRWAPASFRAMIQIKVAPALCHGQGHGTASRRAMLAHPARSIAQPSHTPYPACPGSEPAMRWTDAAHLGLMLAALG